MAGTWDGVRERVLALREAPRWRAIFGADFQGYGHRFELLPVLTDDELRTAEQRLGTGLPTEYRTFLQQVGAGGAGPDHGLFPLRPDERGEGPDTGRCARPFEPERPAELARHEATEPTRNDYPDAASFTAAHAAWEARYDELDDALTDGTLCIGEQGCGYYSLLVVTGPLSGTAWDDVRAVGEGVAPTRRRGPRGW